MDKITDQSYKIPLHNELSKCPIHWQNFVRACQSDDEGKQEKIVTEAFINEANGRFYLDNGELEPIDQYYNNVAGLIFESSEDATAFILKWS